MGWGAEIKCPKCDFNTTVYFGIGMGYPSVCRRILESMKNGELGKGFKDDATSIPHPAVHQERALFVCEKCGELREDQIINLCTPIGEYKPNTARFSVAIEYPPEMPYVMTYKLGKEYRIVRSKRHQCGKCRGNMVPVEDFEKVKCPHCGEILEVNDCINWD